MTNHSASSRPRARGYRRAYKACLQCRAKKARCLITAEEHAIGLPCDRCRRELRCCTFPAERQGAKLDSSILPSNAPLDLIGLGQKEATTGSPLQPSATVAESAMNAETLDWDPLCFVDNSAESLQWPGNDMTSASHLNSASMISPHRLVQEHGLQSNCPTSPITRYVPVDHITEGWKRCPYVQQGWLTAGEAMHLVNYFFRAMAPRTYVLDRALNANQSWHELAIQEPFLCCAILMASSRHHNLGSYSDKPRTRWLHQRLSGCCLQFVTNIITGREAVYGARLRTLRSVDALLLLAEWHPLSLFMDLDDDDHRLNRPVLGATNDSARPQDLSSRARKSDKTSAMIFSCAVALANELGVFHDDSDLIQVLPASAQDQQRRCQLRDILWMYNGHLSLRVGVKTMLPASYSRPIEDVENPSPVSPAERDEQQWMRHMKARAELIGISNAIKEDLWHFYMQPSRTALRRSYESMGEAIDHLKFMLNAWWLKYLDPGSASFIDVCYHDCLTEEHQTAWIITNLAGLAAINTSSGSKQWPLVPDASTLRLRRSFVDCVVEGATNILQLSCSLAQQGLLLHATEDLYMRIAVAASSLYVALLQHNDSSTCIALCELLRKVADNLWTDTADNVHPANLYAEQIWRLADSMASMNAAFGEGVRQSVDFGADSSSYQSPMGVAGPAHFGTPGNDKAFNLVPMSTTLETMLMEFEPQITVRC